MTTEDMNWLRLPSEYVSIHPARRGSELLPAGRLVRVEVEICLPVAATKRQIEDWMKLHFGCGGMSRDNPLGHVDPEPFTGQVLLTDMRQSGRRVEFDRRATENGGSVYRVRYERTPA